MFWSRLGSLHALEEHRLARFWKRWLGRSPGSSDTLGRVHAGLAAQELREGLHHVYSRLKRNKALPGIGGLSVAVLDGHETHASYRRRCSGCLQRTIHTEQGERIQYYHRNVTLQLLTGSELRILLDLEPQRPGEDEVTTARRLLERVLARYPRAFQLLLADGLYAQAPFFNLLLAHGKHALVVLKERAAGPLPGCLRFVCADSARSGKVSVAPLPVVGRIGLHHLAPSPRSAAGHPFARNLLGAPPDYHAG